MHWNRTLRCALAAALVAFVPHAAAQDGRGDVVYVPTPQVVVEEMLRMAKIGPKDFLIDLGSGDGRIVITAVKQFGAQGFGVDLDTYLLKKARDVASVEGIADRARFVEQNLFETDLSKATVISSYLLPEMNLRLRPKILALKPGTRVVAHDYHMGDWYPDEQKDIVVPEKKVGTPGVSYVYLWVVPSRVAGKWQGSMSAAGKDVPLELAFEQLFQIVDGTLRVGATATQFRGRISNGDQITFVTQPKDSPGKERHEFRGRIAGDTIEGTVRIGEGPKARESKFTARVSARGELKRADDELASR
jgi:hypothetical protein